MNQTDRLFHLLENATSRFHTVKAVEQQLQEKGFERLYLKDRWQLKKGGKYMVVHHGSTLFAFTVGVDFEQGDSFRIAASHGDFPNRSRSSDFVRPHNQRAWRDSNPRPTA